MISEYTNKFLSLVSLRFAKPEEEIEYEKEMKNFQSKALIYLLIVAFVLRCSNGYSLSRYEFSSTITILMTTSMPIEIFLT
jgi:hypothetical protein